MNYDEIHDWLGWPAPEQTFNPEGAGAKVHAGFARKKILEEIKRQHPGMELQAGIIAADPRTDTSEAPLALICEFPRAVREEVLDLVHKLAWNFSRTALLVTLEPHRLIAWSCHQDPSLPMDKRRIRSCEPPKPGNPKPAGTRQQHEIRDLLHWVNLITQRAQREHPQYFPADGRADALLLKNLRYVREELLKMGLAREFCHDLLARIIFTQFLFHRKDSDGHAFFNPCMMDRLHADHVLSQVHENLASVLSHKNDTYALFRWMDEKFNGDLFPSKANDDTKTKETAWEAERKAVTDTHLELLAGLIRGDLDVTDRQHTLWPFYSFDTIPLEFISSVYEEFLTADERRTDKAYYTPSHLVDYVLDAVLPWNDPNWNIRILDPCCGSAIFLVKAFQRLIHRWRLANPGKPSPLVTDLRPILENNLTGVDANKEAVRVACFSLYLAMADAIEPKHYITRDNCKVFPRLRGTRLIAQDFFDEHTEGICTANTTNRYDLVIGNAPWGDNSIRIKKLHKETSTEYKKRIAALPPTKAQEWAVLHQWPVANNDIGPLFLAKAAALLKPDGKAAMINTASLLYWRDGKARELRRKLFTDFTVDEVTNLSALRREIFTEAIGPACTIIFGKERPQPQTTLYYFTPKPARTTRQIRGRQAPSQGFTIEPHDINTLTHAEAAEESTIWPLLALGRRRDLALVRKLMGLRNLKKMEASSQIITRIGVIPGDRKKTLPNDFKERHYFELKQFPATVFLKMDAANIPLWKDPKIDNKGSTNFEAFKHPQLLIKQSFATKAGRFRAALITTNDPEWGVICKETYLSVRDLDRQGSTIRAACVVYNSRLAAYFLALTSSRIGHYITETLSEELLTVPLPASAPGISTFNSFEAVDKATREMFALTPAEWNLVEDFLDHSLPDALRKTPGPARFKTRRKDQDNKVEPELTDYIRTFTRVLEGTFGSKRKTAATLYTETGEQQLPVRMITLHLDAPNRDPLKIQPMEADGLLDQLTRFHADQLKKKTRNTTGNGLGFQRVAWFFHRDHEDGVMNLTLIKPDERRYWTRSTAMHDADDFAAAIAKAGRQPITKA
jgi:type I restriction-modification system DNA methylase subunit